MTPQEENRFQAILDEAKSSYERAEKRSGKWNLILGALLAGSIVGNIFQGWAVKGLTPLKELVPMIAVVDSQTGITTSVERFESTTDPDLIKKLVTSYFWDTISNRYGYYGKVGSEQLADQYNKASIFLANNDRNDFEAEVSALNAQSPYNLIGELGSITPKVISLNFLSDTKVIATFRTIVVRGAEVKQFSYTVSADFETNNFDDLSVKDRWINPFGVKFKNWNLTQNASNDALLNTNSAQQQPIVNQSSAPASEPTTSDN